MLIPLAIAAFALASAKKPVSRIAPAATAASPADAGGFSLDRADVREAIVQAARSIGVEPAVLKAVIRVESAGKPFAPDGKLLIRFEPHVFARLTEKAGKRATVLNPGMKDIANPRQRSGGQAGEWATLDRAMGVNPELALQATSFGLPQVMGMNYKALGYASARAMFADFQRSWAAQIAGMAKFVASSSKMLAAMKAKDWPRFVAVYNGAKVGSKSNATYSNKLQAAYSSEERGMAGPFTLPPARRINRAIVNDRIQIVRAQRRAVLRAWMHGGGFRRARLANMRSAKLLGWAARGQFRSPADPALAIMIFRIQQRDGIKPSGVLNPKTLRSLRRHIQMQSPVGRWAQASLVIRPALHGMGEDAQTPPGRKRAKPSFLERVGSGLIDKAKEDQAAAKERKKRKEDQAHELRLAEINAKAKAQWSSPMPQNLPRPHMPRRGGLEKYLPYILGGGALLAVLLLNRPQPAQQQPVLLAA